MFSIIFNLVNIETNYFLVSNLSVDVNSWGRQSVIPRVTFIRSATILPLGIVGSLRSTFVPARQVDLAVKLPSVFALEGQSPSDSRKPLHASVTFEEAYAI